AAKTIRTYTGKPKPAKGEKKDDAKDKDGDDDGDSDDKAAQQLPGEIGLNRFVWDLTYDPPKGFPGLILWSGQLAGPVAIPGTYQARLAVGTETATVPFTVLADPRSHSTQVDQKAQLDFLLGLRDEIDRMHDALRRVRRVR